MDDQIEKLIVHAGGSGRYQIIILLIGFFVWQCCSLHNTSIPMLETMPKVRMDGKKETEKLDYDLCKGKYDIVDDIGFSWIIDMGIKCDQAKVGLIGSIVSFGLTVGTLVFSIMTKYLSYRALIIIFTYLYVFFIFLTTIVDSFEFRLF